MKTDKIGSLGFVNTYKDKLPVIVTDEITPMEKLMKFSNLVAQEKPAETDAGASAGSKAVTEEDVEINDLQGVDRAEWAKYVTDNKISNVNLVSCIENFLAKTEEIDKIPQKDLTHEDIKKRGAYVGKLSVVFDELRKRTKNDAMALYNELNNEKVLDKLFSLILKIKDKCTVAGFPFLSEKANKFTERFGIKMANGINARLAAYNKAVAESKTPDEVPFDIGMEYGRFVGALYREVIDKVSPNTPLKISWDAVKASTTATVGASTPGAGSSPKLPPLPTLPTAPASTAAPSKIPDISSVVSGSIEIDVIKLLDSIVTQVSNNKIGKILKEVKMDKPFISIKLNKNTLTEFKLGFYEGMNQYIASFVKYTKE